MLRVFPSFKYLWAGVILFLTLRPGGNEHLFEFLGYPGVDKIGHFGLFFIWTLLFFPETIFFRQLPPSQYGKFWIAATNSLVLGLLIEIAQAYIPGRSSEYMDVLADMLGSVTALVAVKIVRQKKSDLN